MSKKAQVSLMEKALNPSVEVTVIDPARAVAIAPAHRAPAGPWYAAVLAKYPCDPEQRAYVIDQITAAKEWGGDNHLVRVPMDLFLKLLEERREKV